MANLDKFIKSLRFQDFYKNQIFKTIDIPERKAKYGSLEKPLPAVLQEYLNKFGIKLWSHQAQALNLIQSGKNVVVSTSTASGKSLIYNLSVLSSILEDSDACAIYVFPMKALAGDQQEGLNQILSETMIEPDIVGIYDGDKDPEEKTEILSKANIIITNPYGLHQYLPWFGKKWGRICQNLKYIVIDEIHTYKGIFGSNFAFLVRRLKRILDIYGVKPIWILSSATINNPKEFAEKLVGENFSIVDEDGSPSGKKKVVLWELPYNEKENKYDSTHQETNKLYLYHIENGLQTLTFTNSRKMAELQAFWAKEKLGEDKNRVDSYTAAISKNRRREIEKRFKNKQLLGISSTNALELGIDIGTLDATISSGFPGTITSFKQQIGRSGRGKKPSISTLVPFENPLDSFYVHNPDVLLDSKQENVLITLKNRYILKNHLCCASHESPLDLTEYKNFGVENKDEFLSIIQELVSDNILRKEGKQFCWNLKEYPPKKYPLSNLSDRSYEIILRSPNDNDTPLTTEDEIYVFRDLHLGAVYFYEAEMYEVDEFNLSQRKVYVKKLENTNYITHSLRTTTITPITENINKKLIICNKTLEVFFGKVKVIENYHSFNKLDIYSQEKRSTHPLDLPPIEFETQAMWFCIPKEYVNELELKKYNLGGTIHAIEHAAIAISPIFLQISRWDLGGVSIDHDSDKKQPVIYIYDAFWGGIGIAEDLYQNVMKLLSFTLQLIKTCSCKTPNGCPCCIVSPRCGSMNEPLDKEGALFILEKLLEYKEIPIRKSDDDDFDDDDFDEDEFDEDEFDEDEFDEDEFDEDDDSLEVQHFEGSFGSPIRGDSNKDLSIKCNKCGNNMKLIHGKNGAFIGCSAFWSPTKCNFTFVWNQRGEQEKLKCPKCNHNLDVKTGRYGRFLGCSRYPECDFTYKIDR